MKYFVRRSKIKGWKRNGMHRFGNGVGRQKCYTRVADFQQIEMDGVLIVQYLDSVAGNLDWQAVRMRVIVPEDRYREGWTEDALRMYAIIRSRNVPDRIDIAIYGSMEGFRECEEYAEASYEK